MNEINVKGQEVYILATADVETKELLAIDASYQRSGLNVYLEVQE